jgi:hypothetical protein
MSRVFDAMDSDNGVLIGTPDCLIGILAPMDFLRYLYQVASPFVMVSEIELALRALIRLSLTDSELALVASRCLAGVHNSEQKAPETLEDMTFENYRSIISCGETWPRFERLFGGLGVVGPTIERCLDHAVPGVAGVYNRYAYNKETAATWKLWGEHVSGLLADRSKVAVAA